MRLPAVHLPANRERGRLLLVVLVTLLPWPMVWLGMYRLDSLWATFLLYHGLCLAPVIYWGRRWWRGSWRLPTARQTAALAMGVAISLPLFVWAYGAIGAWFINAPALLHMVSRRGFHAHWLLPLGLYFVPVNATLEELFWRGVVLNALRGLGKPAWTLGAVWTACTFAAWHWLVLRLLLRPGWAEAAVLGIVAAGFFFSWLYRRTGSIVVPILWHALVFDLALILVFAAILRGGA
jgi:membrane protease YdiL (CAAX protease family)